MDRDKKKSRGPESDFFARNLAAYEKYQSLYTPWFDRKTGEWEEAWREGGGEEEQEEILVEEAKNGSKIFSLPFYGAKLYFNSRYSPQEEAAFFVSNFYRPECEVIFLIGMGFGYRVRELLKIMNPNQKLLIVEPDRRIFKAAMENIELSSVFTDERVCFHLYREENSCRQFVEEALEKERLSFSRGSVLTLVPPPYSHVYRMVTEEIKKSTGYTLKHIQSLQNTILSFSELWLENYLKNIRFFDASIELESLFGRFFKVPAYLVSAGPSLRKNVKELKKAEGRGIIFTGYTALKVLLMNGIRPDFVVALDGRQLNYETEEMLREKFEIPLIYSPFVDYRLLEKHQGIKIRCTVSYDSYSQYLDQKLGKPVRPLYAAGTVAATMMDIAYQMGCRPIIFAGQDLAYSDDFTHVPGTSYDAFLKKHHYDIRQHSFLLVKDVFEREVKTDYVFLQYKKGLEDYIRLKKESGLFLDATEGGVRIEGTELSSLAEAVKSEGPFPVTGLKELLREELCSSEGSRRKFMKSACQDVCRSLRKLEELVLRLEKMAAKIDKILTKRKEAGEQEETSEHEKLKDFAQIIDEINQCNEKIEKFYENSVLFELAVLGTIFSAEKESRNLEKNNKSEKECYLFQMLDLYQKIISLYQNAKAVWSGTKLKPD